MITLILLQRAFCATALKAIGKESMAILSGEENLQFHCRSIVTQIPING